MSKPRKAVLDWLVYMAVRCLVGLFQALPPEAGQTVARVLASLVYRLDRRHRRVALDNLREAYGTTLTESCRHRLVLLVYRHFCSVLVEIVTLPRRLHPTTWRRYVSLPQGRSLVAALLSGRPVLVVTGHFGNWEMAGYLLGLLGFRAYAVARPLDNPYLDDYLRRFRERTGQRLLAKRGEFDRVQSVLATGGILATLADQDAGQRGVYVEFFGRLASTHKAVALLAVEHAVTIVVAAARKCGEPMRYEVVTGDVIDPEEYAGRADAVPAITARFTAALERLIRTAPSQYFWLHRRWKHRPVARRRAA